MITLLIIGLVISFTINIFREIAYSICRKDKDKLRNGIIHILECGYLINGQGNLSVIKSLENLLKETYP